MEIFVMELDVNIMAWDYLNNGMLLNLIKNLYVPFGISVDPKRYYKNGVYTRMLRRPRSPYDMAILPRDRRHQYLRLEGLQYTDVDIDDFETRLGKIYTRKVHRVQVFDFGGLTDLMTEGLSGGMLMEHRHARGHGVFTCRAWRRLFEIRGPLVHELILEFFSTFRFGEAMLDLDTAGDLYRGDEDCWVWFRLGREWDPMLRLCHRLITYSIDGRSYTPKKIYEELDDMWAWVAPRLERQQVVVAGALEAVEDALTVDKGALAIPAPTQAPQPPARTMAQRLARVEEEVHKIQGALGEQRKVMDAMARDLSRFTVWAARGIS
ncbi:hypothetical protein Tco_1308009 [Tanacetum coccineum]